MSVKFLEHLQPSNKELLQLVNQQVDDSMLQEISEADYGNDRDEHLKLLYEIKAGKFPAPMEWIPTEVLELIRFSNPEDSAWKPGAVGERGHWMRLFSCTVLIRAEVVPENNGRFIGEDTTVIKLVDSALKLGNEASMAALKFLSWRIETQPLNKWDRMYFAPAVLILLVALNKCNPKTAKYLVGSNVHGQFCISEVLDGCLYRKLWREIINSVLIESRSTDDYISKIGKMLVSQIERKAKSS